MNGKVCGLSGIFVFSLGVMKVATTGELRAIIEELELIDIGDAASYLGEEGYSEDVEGVIEEPDWTLFGMAKKSVGDHKHTTQGR